MNILQVISHYVPAYRFGGPLQVAHGLGKALVTFGHNVSVCTTNLQDESTNLDVPLNEPVDVDGVTVYYAPTCCSRYWGFSPQLWRRANTLIAKSDVVLVHFHYQFANWAGAHLARRHAKPYAVFAHGSLKVDAIARKGRWKKNLYLKTAERSNLNEATWLFFNAQEERRASRYGARAHVLTSGVDTEEFDRPAGQSFRAQYPHLSGKLVVLFLGRIDYEGKGLDQLLPAFQCFHTTHPNAHLVLAGPDERGGRTRTGNLVRQLDMQDHVTFTGLLRGPQRIAALRESDLYVLPSPSEGLSISLLEALYVGIPVLVTDQVGLCDRVAESGAGIVARCDSQSLLEGLECLAADDTRGQMRGRATELIRREHGWTAVAEQLLDVIQRNSSPQLDDTATAAAIKASA